ncbi:MAG TPA: GNAT family N-acetyltransferase [Streptosporangiaceae bacterium]|jgi:ribosomal protein S18 acetylase RimI-like enzyme|nr:GNAT family N-acetyltransferase [Streptosporangiaceae bacterium]
MSQLASMTLGTTGFTIRRATAGDVPAVAALLADDDIGAVRELGPGADLAPYTLAFEAIDADPGQLLLVVTTGDGAVAATMQLSFLPGMARQGALRAQIEAVRVSTRYRGQGLGEAMMTWAIAEARRRGCHLAQLTSDKRRTRAHRFYQRLGFTAVSEGFKLPL